jgi:hypothetical protein
MADGTVTVMTAAALIFAPESGDEDHGYVTEMVTCPPSCNSLGSEGAAVTRPSEVTEASAGLLDCHVKVCVGSHTLP